MNLNGQLATGKTNLKHKFALGEKKLKGLYALGIMIFTGTAGPGRQEFNVAGLALYRLTCALRPRATTRGDVFAIVAPGGAAPSRVPARA